MIFTIRFESNPKITVWKGSQKFIFLKMYVLKKAFVDEFRSSIRRYFPKHWCNNLLLSGP